jgi:hypothetical protein
MNELVDILPIVQHLFPFAKGTVPKGRSTNIAFSAALTHPTADRINKTDASSF